MATHDTESLTNPTATSRTKPVRIDNAFDLVAATATRGITPATPSLTPPLPRCDQCFSLQRGVHEAIPTGEPGVLAAGKRFCEQCHAEELADAIAALARGEWTWEIRKRREEERRRRSIRNMATMDPVLQVWLARQRAPTYTDDSLSAEQRGVRLFHVSEVVKEGLRVLLTTMDKDEIASLYDDLQELTSGERWKDVVDRVINEALWACEQKPIGKMRAARIRVAFQLNSTVGRLHWGQSDVG